MKGLLGMRMIEAVIDGKKIKVKEGTTILEASNKIGIDIPTLCYHSALAPIGACRVCIVELVTKGRKRIVTSCNFPLRENVEVSTDTERIRNDRKMIVEFLLARSPESRVLKELAAKLGIEKVRFGFDPKKCIVCGLCVRACNDVMGVGAIDFVSRGVDEDVSTPYGTESPVCIGCGACVSLCPTGAVTLKDEGARRCFDKWKTTLELRRCKACGKSVGPLRHIHYIKKKVILQEDTYELCPSCRRMKYAAVMVAEKHI